MSVKRSTGTGPDTPSLRAATSPAPEGESCGATAVLACLRRPQQERGERRVTAILDAAAELIVEKGPGALTVQALADRARTSKGSLYHFFPDLPSVVRALADRHVDAIGELTQAMMADATIDWRALSVEDTVQRFIAPLAYLESHPDLLALARSPVLDDQRAHRLGPVCDFAEHILAQRYPALPARERHVRACTMVGVLDGVVGYSLRSDDLDAHEMVVELCRVLGGYLEVLDAAFADQAALR